MKKSEVDRPKCHIDGETAAFGAHADFGARGQPSAGWRADGAWLAAWLAGCLAGSWLAVCGACSLLLLPLAALCLLPPWLLHHARCVLAARYTQFSLRLFQPSKKSPKMSFAPPEAHQQFQVRHARQLDPANEPAITIEDEKSAREDRETAEDGMDKCCWHGERGASARQICCPARAGGRRRDGRGAVCRGTT